MQEATIREIAQALTNFCEQFPDLADNKLCVCSESGDTGGVPVLPLRFVMRRVIKYVEAFPAADVQTIKRGRWENEYLDDDDVWWADCTNCKNETHSRFGRVSIYAYCPNCGADMRCE